MLFRIGNVAAAGRGWENSLEWVPRSDSGRGEYSISGYTDNNTKVIHDLFVYQILSQKTICLPKYKQNTLSYKFSTKFIEKYLLSYKIPVIILTPETQDAKYLNTTIICCDGILRTNSLLLIVVFPAIREVMRWRSSTEAGGIICRKNERKTPLFLLLIQKNWVFLQIFSLAPGWPGHYLSSWHQQTGSGGVLRLHPQQNSHLPTQ